MKIYAVTLAVLSLATVAVATSAAAQASDVDYLRASRCRGIAAGLGADGAALDSYLKAAGRTRAPYILDRGQAERDRGKREARGDGKTRLAAELSGPCLAYMGSGKTAPSRGS